MAVIWAERYYEKADGSGYPYALEGKDLDLGVKILAYSDVISALMEERPYRKSQSIDVVMDMIREKMVAKLLTEIFDEIEKHKDRINDLVLQC